MLVCCFRLSQMNFDDGICENGSLSNSIHVWYIYLHLPYKHIYIPGTSNIHLLVVVSIG